MKDNKNIDNIFKDALKNLEASPSPRVWEKIQAQLNKEKKERKVIPLWMQMGGVAALLALLLTVGNWAYNSGDFNSPAITNENTNQTEKELEEKLGDKELNEIRVVSEDTNISNDFFINEEEEEEVKKETITNDVITTISDNGEIVSLKKSREANIASEETKYHSEAKSKEIFTRNDKKLEEITTSEIISTHGKENRISSERILKGGNIKKDSILNSKNEEAIANENSIKAKVAEKQDSLNKPSLLDAIAEQEGLKDETDKKDILERRWQVTPNFAPVYYSGFGNGSSIDPEFSGNPQKGDVNISYGVQVSYAVNKRLSVRTGLNNVDLSYSTSDIYIASGPVAMGLRGVDYGGSQNVVTAINRPSLNNLPSNDFGSLHLKSTSGDARLIQNINYYEVPVELQYAVIDSRFGVNLIGGVSTLFLGNNEISVKADNFSSVLGAANNLSSVSFSTNVGLGLNYKLSKKFIVNVEPMFKYQINPYSDSSVDFKPYYLGVYSGLSFKF